MSRAEGQIRARFGTGSRYEMNELTSGEMTVGIEETDRGKTTELRSSTSTAGPGLRRGSGLSRTPKEERAIAASFGQSQPGMPWPAVAHSPRTPTVNATQDPLSDKPHPGPSIHTRLRPVLEYISNTARVAIMGALLSLPLLAIPSVGSVRLPSITYSRATPKANMVYSS